MRARSGPVSPSTRHRLKASRTPHRPDSPPPAVAQAPPPAPPARCRPHGAGQAGRFARRRRHRRHRHRAWQGPGLRMRAAPPAPRPKSVAVRLRQRQGRPLAAGGRNGQEGTVRGRIGQSGFNALYEFTRDFSPFLGGKTPSVPPNGKHFQQQTLPGRSRALSSSPTSRPCLHSHGGRVPVRALGPGSPPRPSVQSGEFSRLPGDFPSKSVPASAPPQRLQAGCGIWEGLSPPKGCCSSQKGRRDDVSVCPGVQNLCRWALRRPAFPYICIPGSLSSISVRLSKGVLGFLINQGLLGLVSLPTCWITLLKWGEKKTPNPHLSQE